jgi:hypothetical protein
MAATDHPARHDTAEAQADRLVRTFRRVSWQRIEVTSSGDGRGLVTGVRHRLPCTVEVPLDVAMVLRRRGVQSVVRQVAAL